MFDYIKGKITDKNFPYCTVECCNVGYSFLVNSRTLSQIGDIDDEVKIYTKLIHKEDLMLLCGFKTKQERIIFDILTSVSGVGTKVAMALLDEFDSSELVGAVVSEDYKLISRTKGVGAKMAQKIVLELKDKLTKLEIGAKIINADSDSAISNETIAQAAAILQSLGYSQDEYQNAIKTALTGLKKDDAQELLKEALQLLSIF